MNFKREDRIWSLGFWLLLWNSGCRQGGSNPSNPIGRWSVQGLTRVFSYLICVESQTAMLSSGMRHYLLKGYTDTLPVIQSHIIRIFVSSNFYGISLLILVQPCIHVLAYVNNNELRVALKRKRIGCYQRR